MISATWMRKRRDLWTRFDELVRRGQQSGLASLRHAELRELALLYRQTAADLATVREDPASASLAAYLNQVLGRAHNLVYSGAPERARAPLDLLTRDFPRLVREELPLVLASAGIFAGFAVAAWFAAHADPGLVRAYLSTTMRDTIDRREMWTHSIVGVQPAASSAIMTNNMTVAFMTFASGISAGVLTFWLLAHNGVMLGVIGEACARAHMSDKLWSFVVAHGSLELPAIFVAGAAGFVVARGILFPGALPRRVSLERAGARAARLAVGTVPMLVVAGVVEAFVSPTPSPAGLKVALGAALFALWVTWIARGGRDAAPQPAAAAAAPAH